MLSCWKCNWFLMSRVNIPTLGYSTSSISRSLMELRMMSEVRMSGCWSFLMSSRMLTPGHASWELLSELQKGFLQMGRLTKIKLGLNTCLNINLTRIWIFLSTRNTWTQKLGYRFLWKLSNKHFIPKTKRVTLATLKSTIRSRNSKLLCKLPFCNWNLSQVLGSYIWTALLIIVNVYRHFLCTVSR